MLCDRRIGFIGTGAIGSALVQGLITAGLVKRENITVTNRSNTKRLEELTGNWGVRAVGDKAQLVRENDVVVIAVKPKDVKEVMEQAGSELMPRHTVVTLAAGISTHTIQSFSQERIRVVRAMPNTSCLVRESATAVCRGEWADEESVELARELFSAVGKVVLVPEAALDAVTGLSGSGPAYVYYLIEAMTDAGVSAGLTRDVSEALTVQTVLGAARMVMETGQPPRLLREKVTTPNGTTMAGITVLEKAGFKSSMINAVLAAARRSGELGMELENGCRPSGNKQRSAVTKLRKAGAGGI